LTRIAPQTSAAPDKLSGKTPAPRAVGRLSAVALFLIIAVAGLAADLASKHYVFKHLLGDPSLAGEVERLKFLARHSGEPLDPQEALRHLNPHRRLCPGVTLTLSTNPGIVFGLSMPRWLVAIATVVTIGLVFYFFATSAAAARLLHAALACVLAGALGNLYDRLFASVEVPGDGIIRYQVRDFIDCSELYYPWVFNIADVLLVVGVAMLLLNSVLAQQRRKRPS